MMLILILLLSLSKFSLQIDFDDSSERTVQVVTALADTLLTKCTILLESDDADWSEQRRNFDIAKKLSMSVDNGQTVVKTFKQYKEHVAYRTNTHRCSKVLNVVHGEATRKQIQEVSTRSGMAGPVWVVFLLDSISLEEYFNSTYLSFDSVCIAAKIGSDDSIILEQVYRVSKKHPLRVSHFGKWSLESGLALTHTSPLYSYRNDLEKMVFRVGSIENPPMSHFVTTRDGESDLEGYFAGVWKELQERLNFSSKYINPNNYGTGSFDGIRWSGLIGLMLDDQVDAIVSEVTILPERLPIADFLRPLFVTRYQLFFKRPGFMIQWDGLLKPFQTDVWLSLALWLAAAAVLLKILHDISLKRGNEDQKLKKEHNLPRCFFAVFTAFVQQGNPISPQSVSCRIVVFTCYLFSLLIVIAYSGTVTSFIAVKKPRPPFDSLKSFLQDGTYSLAQIPGTAGYTYFSNSSEFVLQQIFKRLFLKLPDKQLPQSHSEALEQVCYKERVAHLGEYDITSISAAQLSQEKGCNFMVLERPLGMVFLTIVVPKGSPYRGIFNYYLGQMKYQGILHRQKITSIPMYTAYNSPKYKSVTAEQVVQMHVILCSGVAISVVAAAAEICLKKYRRFLRYPNNVIGMRNVDNEPSEKRQCRATFAFKL